jgi:plasmid stability protein
MRPLKQAIYSSRTADKFVVRLPDGMREKIATRARTHHRSMNSEIISVLERDLAIELSPEEIATLQLQDHTRPDVQTPVSIGMLAYYEYEDKPGEWSLGVITGLAVSMDDKVSVTFDILPKAPTNIVGSIQNDPRRWFAINHIKPFLI